MSIVDLFSSQLVYKFALAVLTTLVLLTLVSQFGRFLYLELTTHFRLYYVLVALLCALVLAGFQSWKFVPIALFCAALNLVYVIPYYRTTSQSNSGRHDSHLRLIQVNLLKTNQKYQKLLEVVRSANADVVVLQELTETWNEQTQGLRQEYPHVVFEPRSNGAGMAVLSRYPAEGAQTLTLDDSDHIAILVRLKVGDESISVLALHPTTPITPFKFKNRNRQYREAATLVKNLTGPRVIIGDLNITMWSPYFVELQNESGLRDARLGFGLRTTWPTFLPPLLRLPIDHCLVSEEVEINSIEVGASTGSDHLPLIVQLSF